MRPTLYTVVTVTPGVENGLCLADGVAFIKYAGVDLSPYAGVEGSSTPYILILKDALGRQAIGWIGAADAAETLSGSELIVNPGFETLGAGGDDVFGTWADTKLDGLIVDETTLVHAGGSVHAAKLICGPTVTVGRCRIGTPSGADPTVTAGKLYKLSMWTRGDGTYSGYWIAYNVTGAAYFISPILTWNFSCGVAGTTYTQVLRYMTAPSGCEDIRLVFFPYPFDTAAAYFDDLSMQEVTHVGATGVHIVNAKDGSTRNWTYIQSGFNYNDVTYGIAVVRPSALNESLVGCATMGQIG